MVASTVPSPTSPPAQARTSTPSSPSSSRSSTPTGLHRISIPSASTLPINNPYPNSPPSQKYFRNALRDAQGQGVPSRRRGWSMERFSRPLWNTLARVQAAVIPSSPSNRLTSSEASHTPGKFCKPSFPFVGLLDDAASGSEEATLLSCFKYDGQQDNRCRVPSYTNSGVTCGRISPLCPGHRTSGVRTQGLPAARPIPFYIVKHLNSRCDHIITIRLSKGPFYRKSS